MQNLRKYIDGKRQNNEKLLSVFLTTGYPNLHTTLPLLQAIAEGGADMIELGVPFSDPLADGATIQAASQKALDAGATLSYALETASQFTQQVDIPLLLMGYANPFMQFGWDHLIEHAQDAGIGGYIIPDLPPEESKSIIQKMQAAAQSLVFLVSPNTSPERIAAINELTNSFIYAVSITGTTGARSDLSEATENFLQQLHRQTPHPVLVGFGISNPATAKNLSQQCDGVIVGSAMIDCISQFTDIESACKAAFKFTAELKSAL
ncbi:MAG: tryptophan synthase subunit alpha [bacterium]